MAMIGKFVVKGEDIFKKTINENLGDVICDDIFSEDSTTRVAKATEFYNFARGVNALTKVTMLDSEITVVKSINEILGE